MEVIKGKNYYIIILIEKDEKIKFGYNNSNSFQQAQSMKDKEIEL